MSGICPKCGRRLLNPNAWHYCGQKKVSELFAGRESHLQTIYKKIADVIGQWDHSELTPTKNSIVGFHNKTFLVIRLMKRELDLKFYLDCEDLEFPVYKSKLISNGRFETYIRLETEAEVDQNVISLLRKSYDIS